VKRRGCAVLRKYSFEKFIILSFSMILILSCCSLPNLLETPSTEISSKPGETELVRSPAPILHSTAPRMKLIPIYIHKSGSDLRVKFALQNDSDGCFNYTASRESIYLITDEGYTYQASKGSLMSFGYVPPGFTIRGDTLYLEFQVAEGTSGYKLTIPSYTARDETGKEYIIDVPLMIDLEKEVSIPVFPFETPRSDLRKIGEQIELHKLAALSIKDAHMTGQGLLVNYTVQNLSSEQETTVQVDTSIIGENGLVVWGTTQLPPGEHGSVELHLGPDQVASKQMTANVPEGGHYYLILDIRAVSGRSSPSSPPSHIEVVDLGMFPYPITLRFVVLTKVNKGITIDQELQIITSTIPLNNVNSPVLSGLPSKGGCIPGLVQDYDFFRSIGYNVYIQNSNGSHPTKVSSEGLAIRPSTFGEEPLLAWTAVDGNKDGNPSSLQIGKLDGSQIDTLYTITSSDEYPMNLIVDSWSADGNLLYFSKELSNYVFNSFYKSASNLFSIDIRTKEVTNIIGEVPNPDYYPYYYPYPCIDSISQDNRFVADHCTPGFITIRDIKGNNTTTIHISTDIPESEYSFISTSLFNPSGNRVAYEMDQLIGENNLHTWIAIGDSSGGYSNVILESNNDGVYYLLGWLNDHTLLVQFVSNCRECQDHIYTIGADGSNLTQWAIGTLVTVLDCNTATTPSNAVIFKEPTATPTEIAPLPIGNTVQDFSLDTFDGQTIRLSDQKGKIVLINFWASWAVPCEREAPIVQAAWEYYKSRSDVIFLGINIDNIYYKDNVLAFIDKYRITYPNGNDIEQLISQQFRLLGVPETYIIDKNGNLAYDNISPFSSVAEIISIIDPLLQP
jgi:cytochrome c biogenesis protein CcmG/thiol:disulfide interchange protein DsbE